MMMRISMYFKKRETEREERSAMIGYIRTEKENMFSFSLSFSPLMGIRESL